MPGGVRRHSGPRRCQHLRRPALPAGGGPGPVRGGRGLGAVASRPRTSGPNCASGRPRRWSSSRPRPGRLRRGALHRRARPGRNGWAASCCGWTPPRRGVLTAAADLRHHGAMAHDRRFRFAAQLSKAPDGSARSWAEQARKAEDLGYSALLMPDHFGDQLAPVPALAAVAAATTTLRMGSPRLRQRLPPPLRAGQGGGHARRAERRPLRNEPRRRLDAHRLRRGRPDLRPPGGPGGALRGGGEGRPGSAAHRRSRSTSTASTTRCWGTPSRPGRCSGPVPRSSSAAAASGCCPSPPATPTSSASTSTCARAPAAPRRPPTPRPSAPARRSPG